MEQQLVSESNEAPRGNHEDHEYDAYLTRLSARFSAATQNGAEPLFTTDAYKRHDTALWDAYLNSFPAEQRQFHNCGCCRHFIQRFGTLVTIKDGRTTPAVWDVDDAPDLYKPAVEALARLVRSAKVTGIFLSEETALGQPVTGVWRHFAVLNPNVFKRTVKTAKQTMAERREDFGTVARALSEITPTVLQQAVTLLKTEQLWRSEKVLGGAEWLLKASEERRSLTGPLRDNALWRAIALAPAGFCHPRSSMIGTLIEDIEAGLPFDDVRRKFAAKLNPTIYQRPQAAPSAGNIAQAEKLVEQLGVGPSLVRRFARLEEVESIWLPTPDPEAAGAEGVFGHLKPKGVEVPPAMAIPAQTMTWEKFARTVLPEAKSIELAAPHVGNYVALVTAQNPDAPPILQWDSLDNRNPVSHYVYNGGSRSSDWGVGGWTPITAISLSPASWRGRKLTHQGEAVMFLLKGCRDSRNAGGGNAIFPENLKAEFHAIRSTVEAYSKTAKLLGLEEATACGVMASKGQAFGVHLRVRAANNVVAEYKLDRWD